MNTNQMSMEQLRKHIPYYCLYDGQHGIILYWRGKELVLPISPETAVRIEAAMQAGGTMKTREGYDDDPDGVFYSLHGNDYISLLTRDEQQAVARFFEEAEPRLHQEQRHSPITGHFLR